MKVTFIWRFVSVHVHCYSFLYASKTETAVLSLKMIGAIV